MSVTNVPKGYLNGTKRRGVVESEVWCVDPSVGRRIVV